MKNKTLLSFIIFSIVINILFIVSVILKLVYNGQPYTAIFITLFMFVYHIDIRIIIGFIVSLFKSKINIKSKAFIISKKEFTLLEKMGVKKLNKHIITMYKNQFILSNNCDSHCIEIILKNNINAEIVHRVCFLIGLFAILFGYLLSSEELLIYVITSLLASFFFDLPSILLERYNRHRLQKIFNRKQGMSR